MTPRIVGFCCSHSCYEAADLAGRQGLTYPPGVMIVRLPCAGRIEVLHILRAFRHGADAVFVAGCLEGNCTFSNGNFEARKQVEETRGILEALGMDPRRLEMFNIASNQGWRFLQIVEEMTARVEELGPNSLGVSDDDNR